MQHGRAYAGTRKAPLAVHLVRVKAWMPSAVHALAAHPDGRLLAVGREDGDIELTVPTEGYRVESRIPGRKGKGLRSLAWQKGEEDSEPEEGLRKQPPRLFGCGLDGTVFEVNLEKLCYKNVRDVFGGAAWCMKAASSSPLLAVGCEDGAVRLFTTEAGGLEYKKSFPSTGSRVLSIAWGAADGVLFAGNANSLIHCFDVVSGQSMFDMRLEAQRRDEPLVWALAALSDGTLMSGDSYGRVQVWDGMTGTQLQSLTTHEADVLCLCVTQDETRLFASGCDGKVVLVERRQASHDPADTEGDHDEGDGVEATNAVSRQPRQSWEWSMTSMHRKHTHDVHALAIHKKSLDGHLSDGGIGVARKGPVLVSGGLDTSLSLYSVPAFRDKGPQGLQPLPPAPVASLACAVRLVLVVHKSHLDIWEIPKLDSQASSTPKKRRRAADGHNNRGVHNSSVPLLKLRLEPKLEKGVHIACAVLSADGRLVALSNTSETKVYRLAQPTIPGAPLSAKRIRLPRSCTPPALALAFTRDARRLIVASAAGDIRIVDLAAEVRAPSKEGNPELFSDERAKLVHYFEEHANDVSGETANAREYGVVPVTSLSVSACGDWLAAALASGVVHVFNLERLQHHWMIPRIPKRRCAGMRFHDNVPFLVVVDPSNEFHVIDVARRKLAEYHREVDLPKVPSGRGVWGGEGDDHPLAGVAFQPGQNLHSMLFYNHRYVMHVLPKQNIPRSVAVDSGTRLRIAKQDGSTNVETSGSNFHIIKDFHSVLLLDFLQKNELLVWENPWDSVRDSLPEMLDRKRYGV